MVEIIHSETELITWKYQPPSEGYLKREYYFKQFFIKIRTKLTIFWDLDL